MDPVLFARFFPILIMGREVLAIQVIKFAIRLVDIMFVRSYPPLSIYTLCAAKIHADLEGSESHTHSHISNCEKHHAE